MVKISIMLLVNRGYKVCQFVNAVTAHLEHGHCSLTLRDETEHNHIYL